MVPCDEAFVDIIARAIAIDRLHRDAANTVGVPQEAYDEEVAPVFELMFEALWKGNTDLDERQRAGFRQDAIAAINAINLRMITLTD